MKKLVFISTFVFCTLCGFSQTIGCKLATVSDGKYHTESDPLVKRYNKILTQLDNKYVETNERIADMTTVAKNELANDRFSEPLINIMEGINLLSDKYTSNKKYADNVSLYIILRHQGNGHSSAVQNMQKLLNTGSMDAIMNEMGLR